MRKLILLLTSCLILGVFSYTLLPLDLLHAQFNLEMSEEGMGIEKNQDDEVENLNDRVDRILTDNEEFTYFLSEELSSEFRYTFVIKATIQQINTPPPRVNLSFKPMT